MNRNDTTHFLVNWVPQKYKEKLNIVWTAKFGLRRDKGPTVWFEHGHRCNPEPQETRCDYFICSSKEVYEFLLAKGRKAYWCGSYFNDMVAPRYRNPHLFVYAPTHLLLEKIGLYGQDLDPLTRDEIAEYCRVYQCDGFVTSICDDTEFGMYAHLNPIDSNRWHGDSHIWKCRYIYENAKVVCSDLSNSTFEDAALAFGVSCFARENRSGLAGVQATTLYDGQCRERILAALNEILRVEGLE